jgi:hypothetical protein
MQKVSFILTLAMTISFGLFGQTYYWVGGAGNWTDLSKWASCSGCAGGAFVQVPQSTNDVVIDAGSGFSAVPVANNRTITLNTGGANVTCRNLTVQPDAAGFRFSGAVRMDVYGDITLSTNMNPLQNLWTGQLFLFGENAQVHNFEGRRLYNSLISVEPTGGQHAFNNFVSATTLRINPNNGTGAVSFNGSILAGTINQNSGAVVFNTIGAGYSAGRITLYSISNGSLQANLAFGATTFTATGGTSNFVGQTTFTTFNLSGVGTAVVVSPITHTWTTFNALANQNSSLNISGARIQGLMNWYLYFAAVQLNATNSILDFTGGGTSNFVPGGQDYNDVFFRSFVNIRRSNNSATTGLGTGRFNSLVFERGLWTLHGSTYTVNPNGLLRMLNGGMYNPEATYLYTIPPFFNLNIGDNAGTEIFGTCGNLLYARRINFNFGANTAANLIANHIRMEEVNAVGAEAPYQAGASSHAVPNTTNNGWLAGAADINLPRTGRYLRWVGPVPADVNNAALYADWHNSANWADGNIHPAAGPNSGLGGECPPILYDSVVFPINSYVRVDSPFIECYSMTWLGAGTFRNINYGNNNALLEIYGSLEWSTDMSLLYNGVIKLRAWEDRHTVRSNGKSFPYKVIVETTADTGAHRLLDAMACPNTSNDYIFELRRGHFNTDGQTFTSQNFSGNSSNFVRQLSLGSSTVNIMGDYLGNNRYCFEVNSTINNLTINAGTSHIHILRTGDANTTNMRILIGSGHHFHRITFYADRPWLFRQNVAGTTSYHQVDFRHSGTVYAYNGCRDSFHLLRTHTINPAALNVFSVTENATTATMIIDSAYFYGNVSFTRDVDYSQLMYLNRGRSYSLATNMAQTQRILAGGKLEAKGTCQQIINISGGFFTSPDPQTGDYLLLINNTASSNNFSHSNSIESGTVAGWSGTNGTPRTLYWYNNVVGANTGDWSSASNWSLADGMMLDENGGNDPLVGNCPPTRIDDVYFTDNSFDNSGDVVQVNIFPKFAECASMYWTMTTQPATFLASSVNERLYIFDNLEFSPLMTNNFITDVYFAGGAHSSTVRSNGIAFRRGVVFNGAASTWTLLDELTALVPIPPNGYSLYLQQGTLNTNNQTVNTFSFYSNYTNSRTLILGSSEINIFGTSSTARPCLDFRGAGLTTNAGSSHIRFWGTQTGTTNFVAYLALNTRYNDITFEAGQGQLVSTNVDINNLTFRNGGWLNTINSRIHKIVSTTTTTGRLFEILGANNTMDSVMLAGSAAFRTSNRYTQLLQLSPARTYTFYANMTQHLSNAAEFYAVGTGGGGEIVFNSSSTNSQSFIRKDSGQVCVDFIYMRDIWAVGNGLSTETPCAAFSCDTAQISSLLPSFSNSGRAIFQGGGNANDQGNNAGWDFTPYPPAPQIRLRYVPPFAVCTNEPYVAVFEIVGQFPIDVNLKFDFNGSIINIDSLDIRPTEGSGTVIDPYIWRVSFMPAPVGITKIAPNDISVIRCFNGDAPGTGENEAFVAPCLLSNQILSFAANCKPEGTIVNWQASQNSSVRAFVLEHSQDGISFAALHETAYQAQNNFDFLAQNHIEGMHYYRLRQINLDGSHDFSNIIAANCGQENAGGLTVFPSPADDKINLHFYSLAKQTYKIEIIDAIGRNVVLQNTAATIGLNRPQLSVETLPAGVYLLRLTDAQQNSSSRQFIISR